MFSFPEGHAYTREERREAKRILLEKAYPQICLALAQGGDKSRIELSLEGTPKYVLECIVDMLENVPWAFSAAGVTNDTVWVAVDAVDKEAAF